MSGLYLYARSSVQHLRGTDRLPGLDDPVLVYSDSLEIPHLFAASEADAFRAQGYVHAAARLWQMEMLRRTAQGRLSELFGPRALSVDRLVRTLDLWGAAGRSLSALPEEVRSLLEAYADGVNAKLEEWHGALPPEFLLLRFRPEPWTPRASVAVGKVMALDLSHWRREISRLRAATLLGPEKLAYLRLPYPAWGPTILPEAHASGEEESRGSRNGIGTRDGAVASGPEDGWDPIAFLSRLSFRGSNSWAVAGRRTRAGAPLLANDMHLALRSPSTWYLVALHASESGLDVAGLSLPGVPGIVVGYNRRMAWGFTNGMVDDMDFVVEAVNLDRSAYRRDTAWAPFAVRAETVFVRGRNEPVVHPVRETLRGPVLSDVLPGIGLTLSVLWTGRYPTTAAEALLRMNRSSSSSEFERALRLFGSPHQNVIYAEAGGPIGYRLTGSVPRRAGWDGSEPVSFHIVGRGWTGFWPPDSLPAALDPPAGYLASANNLQARELFGRIGVDYPVPFRARRIVDRLEAETSWTLGDLMALQRDTWSGLASRLIPRAIAAARRVGADSEALDLADWDLRVGVDSQEAALFHIWLYRLRALVAGDEFRGAERWALFPDLALLRVLEERGGPWADDVGTDTLEELAGLEERAMREALRLAAGRAWGELHRERSVHLLGGNRWLDRLLGLNVGPYPGPGGPHTVRPDDPGLWSPLDSTSWRPPFTSEYGPSERFVAEMGPAGSVGHFLLPTGQNGNPLSRHYRSMAPRWRRSELVPVPIDPEAARERAVDTLRLLPGAVRSGSSRETSPR